MLFSSIPFLYYFLPCVLLLYAIAPRKLKNSVLLFSSLFFYGWGEPKYLILMLISITQGYIFGRLVEKYRGKGLAKLFLTLSVVFSFAMLGYCKYADFFISSFNAVTGLSIPLLKIALPIGISFYTFQIVSYVIDVYRGDVAAQRNYINLAAYISMFPQLIAGPIVRYADIAAQLETRTHSTAKTALGVRRFIIGLSKKILLANVLGELVDVFKNTNDQSVLFYWLYAVAYTLHIYFDFSGYSDMAIGLGRCLGFHFAENFRHPYCCRSITEFWRRWHISLGSFFRDYVYIPMGGNRRHQALNILAVWFLTGLWHGASWNFVLWGLYFGIIVTLEKYTLLRVADRVPRVLLHLYSLLLVVVGWGIFYFEDFSRMGEFFSVFTGHGAPFHDFTVESAFFSNFWLWVTAVVFSMPVYDTITRLAGKWCPASCIGFLTLTVRLLLSIALLALSVSLLVGATNNAFIYTRF